MSTRVYSTSLHNGHWTTDNSGDGFAVGNVGDVTVVWKQITVDGTDLELDGCQLYIMKNATYVLARFAMTLGLFVSENHVDLLDCRYVFNAGDDDEFNVYVSDGEFDLSIFGYVLTGV
jgi:hypothetical protein